MDRKAMPAKTVRNRARREKDQGVVPLDGSRFVLMALKRS